MVDARCAPASLWLVRVLLGGMYAERFAMDMGVRGDRGLPLLSASSVEAYYGFFVTAGRRGVTPAQGSATLI